MSQPSETAVKVPHSIVHKKYDCLIGGELVGAAG